MRNHGFSEHRNTMTCPEMAGDIVNFINHRTAENLIFMGHSMGGKILMALLKEYPEIHPRIKAAIIIDIGP